MLVAAIEDNVSMMTGGKGPTKKYLDALMDSGIFSELNNAEQKTMRRLLSTILDGLETKPGSVYNQMFNQTARADATVLFYQTALTNIRYGKSALDVIYKEFKLKYKKNYKISFDQFFLKRSINIKNLSFKYSGNKSFIFKNFNLKIPANKIIGIIGESGSGKTTLIDIISGILKPISGEIIVDGIKINKNIRKWQNNIGYVSQSVYLLDDSIRKNIAFGIDDKDINNKKVYLSLDLVNLGNFVRKLTKNIYTSVGELGNNLSGGQKQRLGLARIFYKDFNFLILDEVTNSLDKKNEDYIMNSLNIIKKEKTIIIICHNSNIAKKCDVIIDLNKNKIFKTKILKYI
jgi:ABC-type bacteriocin/lantibiotic exporter with double-glycine peptidase domain